MPTILFSGSRRSEAAHPSDARRGPTRRDCIALGVGLLVGPAMARSERRLLVVGDSLSAEYGLPRGQGWVARMEQRLAQDPSLAVRIVNASISGDTTSGGLARLPMLLKTHRPTHVVIELGANDALRGLPLASTRSNLRTMIEQCRETGAAVLLVGMQVPPNYGRRYAEEFSALYRVLAQDTGAELVPFMLSGVADAPDARSLFQPDGIHPVAAAHATILETIWVRLAPWLRKPGRR